MTKELITSVESKIAKLGSCGDSSCYIERPEGMCTNGGCRCPEWKFRAMTLILRRLLDDLKDVA